MSCRDLVKPIGLFYFGLFFGITTVLLAKLFWRYFFFVAEF